jgi:hypothetical protein
MQTNMDCKFKLGKVAMSSGALNVLQNSDQSAMVFLQRHAVGDWGEVCDADKKLNDDAIACEGNMDRQQRVFSSYKTANNERIWVITEWDRSVTTLLLPDEY